MELPILKTTSMITVRDLSGRPVYTYQDVAQAMSVEVARPRQQFSRNADNWLEGETGVYQIDTASGSQAVRWFTARGAMRFCRFVKSERADALYNHLLDLWEAERTSATTHVVVAEPTPLAVDSPAWAVELMRALGGATVEIKRDMTQVKADTQANTEELQRIAAAQGHEARWREEHNPEATHALVGDFKRIKDQVVPQLVSRRPDLKQEEASRRFHGEFTRWCKAGAGIHSTLTPGLITVSQGKRLVEKAIERTRELGVTGVSVPQRFAS